MIERIYTSCDSNMQVRSEHYGADHLLEKIKNGTNVEVRHSLLDSIIVSKQLEERIRDATKKEVRYLDISKIKLTKLYNTNFVLKAFRKTTQLESIRKKYIEEERNEKFWKDVVKEVLLLVIAIATFIWNAFGLDTSIKINTIAVPLRPAILLVIILMFFLIFCVYKCKKNRKKLEYYVSEIEKSLKDLLKEDVDKVLSLLKPQKCNLNNHCINLIVNAYHLPDIILQILRSFISFQTNEQGRLKSKNIANVIFSLQDIESPFYQCNIPMYSLTLKQLTYVEKLEFLEYSNKKHNRRQSEFQKIILKHLGIDVINDVYSISDLDKIRKNLSVYKNFKKQLDFMEKETKESRDTIVILLYFYAYLTNINGRTFTKSELINLIKNENDNNENLCTIIKAQLSIPTNSEGINKLATHIFKYFNEIYDSDYRFKDYLGAILYLCADNVIDDNITEITKLCILKIPKAKLQDEDTYAFTVKACNFLADKPNVANYDFYRLLLTETEQRGLIDLHYAIFDIINSHMQTEEELKQKIAESPDIIHSAFMSLVHSPYEEVLLQHIKFINTCASTRKTSIKDKLSECPVYMDIFILNPEIREQYYANLMSIDKKTLEFIGYLYKLYCVSLKNNDIICDSFFFINESLVDVDKTNLINDIKNLCKCEQFKNSIFDDFIFNIQEIMISIEDYELSNYSRELYSFLIKLCYYVNNTILEENFAKFIDLIVKSDNLGIITRCELMSKFAFYKNYQERKISEFLTCNVDKLIEIMNACVQEEKFTIELAYKFISNICCVNNYVAENNERIDLRDVYVKLIEKRFPNEFDKFREDTNVLMYDKILECTNIRDLIRRMSLIDANLVSSTLWLCLYYDEELTINLIREYFESLKNATLASRVALMVLYLNDERITVNQADTDILYYLIPIIEEINYKNNLLELQKALIKWRSLLGNSYNQAYIRTIEKIYKLRELKLKTDAMEENNDEYLEEDLENLKIERGNEIEAFKNAEVIRDFYSKNFLKKKPDGKYIKFTESLQHKVFLNLFDYATNEADIYDLVNIVFSNTTACDQTDLLFENSEFLFIWANALYIFNEFSDDGQNMLMMAHLFATGLADFKEASDDSFFEALKKENPDCITIKKYDDFKACSVGMQNAVIKSCMKRIAPICCAYDSVFGDMLANISINSGITEYVDSFISNSQRQLHKKICKDAEYNLILSVFDYIHQHKIQGEQTFEQLSKILDNVYTFFDSIIKSSPTSSYCVSFSEFCDSDKNEQKSAIINFKQRLDFWKTAYD